MAGTARLRGTTDRHASGSNTEPGLIQKHKAIGAIPNAHCPPCMALARHTNKPNQDNKEQ